MISLNEKMAHLFHWPSYREYQENLIQIVAVPNEVHGQLYYKKKWVSRTFENEVKGINEKGTFDAVFWVLSCKQIKEGENFVTTFDFANPIRLIDIQYIEEKNDYYYINYIMKDFISNLGKISDKKNLKDYLKIEFGSSEAPYPGSEKGFVHIGPNIALAGKSHPSLNELYRILEDIPSAYNEEIKIKDYPLIKIEGIEGCKVNKKGLYKLSLNKIYKIAFSYLQGDSHRNRNIYINENRFIGKSVSDKISTDEIRKGKEKIVVACRCDSLNFQIILNIVVKTPWYKWRFTPLLFFGGISAFFVWLFIKKLFPNAGNAINTALIIPIFIIVIDKIWEVLTKTN